MNIPSTVPAGEVAVVVPSYNHADYIEACLRSVFMQTHAPRTLLVIDDGSRDGSPQKIERVLAECPFPAELIARGNRGLSATLNEGLARTAGSRYFAYLGSDDLWVPERLELGVKALEAKPEAVMAYGSTYIIDAGGAVVGNSGDWEEYVDGDVFHALLQARSIPPSTTMLYRRSAVEQVGWNSESRLEDYENFLGMARLGPFAYIPRPLGYWREHAHNTSKDVEMVLAAYLDAQRRLGPAMGLSPRELQESAARIRFRYAGYFLDRGERGRAARLTLGNLHGAGSLMIALRRLARLATPEVLLRRRVAALRRRGEKRYAAAQPE